jgi:elongation factor G
MEDFGTLCEVPQPVFFSSIEAGSVSQQKVLDQALERLCREDPSVVVRVDEDTGQTVIGGHIPRTLGLTI